MSSNRRPSFSAVPGQDEDGILELKKTVSQEAERRLSLSNVAEAVPEHAVVSSHPSPILETPSFEPSEMERFIATRAGDATLVSAPTNDEQKSPLHEPPSGVINEATTMLSPEAAGEPITPQCETLAASVDDQVDGSSPSTKVGVMNLVSASASAQKHRSHIPLNQGTTKKSTPSSGNKRRIPSIQNTTPALNRDTDDPPSYAKLIDRPRHAYSIAVKDDNSPPSKEQGSKAPRNKRGSSHPTAPTASSAARQEPPRSRNTSGQHAAKGSNSTQAAAATVQKAFRAVKPTKKTASHEQGSQSANLAHLMAPTASSTAKQDATEHDVSLQRTASSAHRKPLNTSGFSRDTSKTQPSSFKSSITGTVSTRASLSSSRSVGDEKSSPEEARDGGRTTSRKVTPLASSFLERMTRPTAATTNKAHGKAEVSSPPHKASSRTTTTRGMRANGDGGVNGMLKRNSANSSFTHDGTAIGNKELGEGQYLATASGNERPRMPKTPTKTADSHTSPSAIGKTPDGIFTPPGKTFNGERGIGEATGMSNMPETPTIH